MISISNVSAPNALVSGLTTIGAANQQLTQDSQQIAQQIADPESNDCIASLLDLQESLVLAETGASVIRASNSMLGTLLNVMA